MSYKDFTDKYLPYAIAATKNTEILPETAITVAALESGLGKSSLAAKYNNFFGITTSEPTGVPEGTKLVSGKVNLPTSEFINGKYVKMDRWFKTYTTPQGSFIDFVRVALLPYYTDKGIRQANTANAQFKALAAGGYATAPDYYQKLVKLRKLMFGSDNTKIYVGIAGALFTIGLIKYIKDEPRQKRNVKTKAAA